MKTRIWIATLCIASGQAVSAANNCAVVFDLPPPVRAANYQTWGASLTKTFADTTLTDLQIGAFSFSDPSGTNSRPSLDSLPFSDKIKKAMKTPVALEIDMANRFGGGAVVYRNDVYPNAHFLSVIKNTPLENGTRKKARNEWWANTIETQPWLEWKSAESKFEYHDRGAQDQILKGLNAVHGETITLYRGTTPFESDTLQLLKELKSASTNQKNVGKKLDAIIQDLTENLDYSTKKNSDNSAADAGVNDQKITHMRTILGNLNSISQLLKKGSLTLAQLTAALKEQLAANYLIGDYSGIFLTDNIDDAKNFSKGRLMKFNVPIAFLQKLNADKKVYLGFEDALEIAVIPSPAMYAMMDLYTTSQAVEVSQVFAH